MPSTKTAKKNLRKSIRRRERNLAKKDAIRQIIRQYKKNLADGNTEEAQANLPKIYKALDKAAKTKLFKPNKSSRLKSRLSSRLNQLTAKSTNASS